MTANDDAIAHAKACRDAMSKGEPRPAYEGADLRDANLYGADLRGANLYRANLRGATLPDGTRVVNRRSVTTAARAVAAYLRQHPDRWVKGQWLYQRKDNGMCGCLHGLCLAQGSGGGELSEALVGAGYGTGWNDEHDRTVDEVIAAVEEVGS